jgi:haloacetate dehalogenase
MFEGFTRDLIETPEATICIRRAGNGPPLLLLHGYPQSHLMWHRIAPALAEEFSVVCADLRGYGDSSKPPTTPDHEPYSKRAMARDQVKVMRALGFERFTVIGHDRGGRVAYRLALDHPDRVERLAVLDIVPTSEMYRRTDMSFAMGYWHWFFLPQPHDFPERVISADPDAFFSWIDQPFFDSNAREQYRRCFSEPDMIRATCEDYRAGATYDFQLDEADRAAGAKIRCPVLALCGSKGLVGRTYDVLEIWRAWADDVQGQPIEGGHFLPEEAPEETLRALRDFLRSPAR